MIKKFLPLFIMLLGAFSLFLSNVIARKTFTIDNFEDWTYLITILTVFFSFSALGTEQLLIRFGKAKEGKFEVPKTTLIVFITGTLFFINLYAYFLNGLLFNFKLEYIEIVLLGSVVSLTQFYYQVRRGSNQFSLGQLYYNAWRIILLSFVLIIGYLQLKLVNAVILSMLLSFGICFLFKQQEFKVRSNGIRFKENFLLGFPMLVALSIMTLLNTYDRVLIDHFSSKIEIGIDFPDYFYFTSIFITPFTILASFFGYTEAKEFKKGFQRKYFIYKSITTFIVTLVVSTIWALILHFYGEIIDIPSVSFSTIVIFILLAAVRTSYGIASAAMGICGSAKAINLSNLIFILGLLTTITFIGVVSTITIQILLGVFLFVWLIRYLSYFILLTRGYHV